MKKKKDDDKKKKKKKRNKKKNNNKNKKNKKKKKEKKSDKRIMNTRKTNDFHIRFTISSQPTFTVGGFPLSSSQFHYRTLFCLSYVPVHVFPLPVKPRLQLQLYEPIVLLHCAFT